MSRPVKKQVDQPTPTYRFPDSASAVVEMLTPELALSYINKNSRNRNINREHVKFISDAIRAGDFMFTGESIKFDNKGRMIDGQHRCLAVVDTGATVPVVVVRGLVPDVQYVIDTGKSRTAAESLEFDGVTSNTSTVAAAARTAIQWENGLLRKITKSPHPGRRISNVEIKNWVSVNSDIHEAASIGRMTARSSNLIPAPTAFAAFLLRKIDVDQTSLFFADIAGMRTEGPGDPVNALIRRLQTAKDRREDMHGAHYLYFIFRTWNARRDGETYSQLKLATDIPLPH